MLTPFSTFTENGHLVSGLLVLFLVYCCIFFIFYDVDPLNYSLMYCKFKRRNLYAIELSKRVVYFEGILRSLNYGEVEKLRELLSFGMSRG